MNRRNTLILAALLWAVVSAANAGALIAPGYTCTDTMIDMPAGAFIGGFDILPNGNYVINDGYAIRVIAPDGTEDDPLYTYTSPVYGSFVRYSDGMVYFGESSNGTIRRVPASGGTESPVATLADNFDMDFRGGDGYVVAGNSIYLLTESGPDQIASAGNNSGPLAFDTSGNLYHAPSRYPDSTSILMWTASEVTGAEGPGILAEQDADIITPDGISGAYGFAFDSASRLLFTNNSLATPGIQVCTNGSVGTLATFDTSIGVFPFLTFVRCNPANGSISIALSWCDSDYASYTSISTLMPVPEPSSLSAMILLVGFAAGPKLFRRTGYSL